MSEFILLTSKIDKQQKKKKMNKLAPERDREIESIREFLRDNNFYEASVIKKKKNKNKNNLLGIYNRVYCTMLRFLKVI